MAALPAPVHNTIWHATNWRIAFGVATLGHIALGGAIVAQHSEARPQQLPDPVMVIELAQGAAPAPAQNIAPMEQPRFDQPLPNMVAPRFDIPKVDAPLPPDPVTLPTSQPAPQRIQPRPRQIQPVSSPAPAPAVAPPAPAIGTSNSGTGAGNDSRAQQAEQDWYALVSAHLERNKRYPREARRDALEGTPTVRFTVNRRGRVTDISIRNSSGYPALDEATISLLRRVSPLPPMPRAMERDSVTISLPIEYSLSRK